MRGKPTPQGSDGCHDRTIAGRARGAELGSDFEPRHDRRPTPLTRFVRGAILAVESFAPPETLSGGCRERRDQHRAVLTSTIAYYQKLGCWTPHVEITRPAFEVALDVFQHAGLVTRWHTYEDVVAAPPDTA
jgi:hypothetical protein